MNCPKITSLSNPKIKETLDISVRRSKYRHNAFIIEGPRLIEMALQSGDRIKRVFFTEPFSSKKDGKKILEQLLGHIDEIFEVPEHILRRLADTETPQGIMAVVSYTPKSLDEIKFSSKPLIAIADGIQEPGNLGTIIRTSDAAGADAVIMLKGTCDVFMQKTIRATAGSIFNIPIVYAEKERLLEWLGSKGISMIATALDAGESIFDANLNQPLAFVFGNEAHGVSPEIKRNAGSMVKIPIPGKAESLNVSVSAAVCLYEAVRQRINVKG